MTIVEQKKALRKQMHLLRGQMEVGQKTEYDPRICEAIWQIIQSKGFKTVHCYLPMGSEINVEPLIDLMLRSSIQVVAPKTLFKRKLQNLILNSLDDTEQGIFKTKHPANSKEFEGDFDLIIIPGMAFDNQYFRLGYGGGYYDNFLSQNPSAYKLGICYPFQRVENVPTEAHDFQLDEILSFADNAG